MYSSLISLSKTVRSVLVSPYELLLQVIDFICVFSDTCFQYCRAVQLNNSILAAHTRVYILCWHFSLTRRFYSLFPGWRRDMWSAEWKSMRMFSGGARQRARVEWEKSVLSFASQWERAPRAVWQKWGAHPPCLCAINWSGSNAQNDLLFCQTRRATSRFIYAKNQWCYIYIAPARQH